MSLTVDKLSLLASLAPLRNGGGVASTTRQDTGFAEKLDDALGNDGVSTGRDVGKARELAEALTLQMLQSSLSLAGEPSGVGTPPPLGPQAFSPVNSLIRAYEANRSDSGAQPPAASSSDQPHRAEQQVVASASAEKAKSESARGNTSWLDPIIEKASRRYGVDVGLIKAVIKAESDFNPRAVSHAGARGLMQLMPATARSLGVDDSFDPEQNVMGGTRFLKDLLQRYGGDVDSALAAYNWGPGNVDRRSGRLPKETRDYLVRVKQLYSTYSG